MPMIVKDHNESSRLYCVYKHTSPSGKVYVGITSRNPNRRWSGGSGYKNNKYLTNAIEKYGWASFRHEILKDGLTKEEASREEQEYILEFRSNEREYGYNMTSGGECGYHFSKEVTDKMSLDRKGRTPTDQARANMSLSRTGVPFSQCHSKKISDAMSGANNPMYGKKLSIETIEKLRNVNRNINGKQVICVETGVIYKSASDAARSVGGNNSKISSVCRGERKVSSGFHWMYLSDCDLYKDGVMVVDFENDVVSDIKVYGLEDSVRASKYPKAVDVTKCTSNVTTTTDGLATASIGSGHDNFLNGIIVQFDLRFTVKAWTEEERYHFIDFVSSQSTMHKIMSFDLDKSYIKYVDKRIINIMKQLVSEYNQSPSTDGFLTVVYSNPVGFQLTARMTTNYRQLKTIYSQRKTHRLPEWRSFCKFCEALPHSEWITGITE